MRSIYFTVLEGSHDFAISFRYSCHEYERFLHETAGQILLAKHDAVMPTESQILQDCFMGTDCFRATVPSGVKIINYKNNLSVAYKPSPLYRILDIY
jgi:hypothetical protein